MVKVVRLLSIALLATLIACGPGVPSHVPIDPALASLVPADTVMLAGARVDQLRETFLLDQLTERQPPERLKQFIDSTGIDPAKDLWELLMASNGARSVLMARGKFSASGMEPRVDWEGSRRMPYRGYLMVGDDNSAVLFVNTTTALLAQPELLRSIIDAREQSTGIPPPLLEKVESIEYGNQIWMAAIGGWFDVPPGSGNLGNVLQFLQRVEGVTLAVSLHRDFYLILKGDCANPEDAETVLGAARGGLGLLRLGVRGRPTTASLIENFGLARNENSVEVTLNVAADLLQQVLTEMPEREF